MCAIIELRMLGVHVPETEVTAARAARDQAALRSAARKERLDQQRADEEAWLSEWLADEEFNVLDGEDAAPELVELDDDDDEFDICDHPAVDDEIPF